MKVCLPRAGAWILYIIMIKVASDRVYSNSLAPIKMCSDCEAYRLKKQGVTRSDCIRGRGGKWNFMVHLPCGEQSKFKNGPSQKCMKINVFINYRKGPGSRQCHSISVKGNPVYILAWSQARF